jgi:hypothetical protein
MVTRAFFASVEAAPVTPPAPAGADWEHVNSISRHLLQAVDGSALATAAYTPDGADHIADQDAHHRQYVSDSLDAQTITGNVKAQLQCLEANAGNNLFLTIKVMVIDSAGSSVLSTLLAITRDTTNEVATSLTNRNFPSTAMGSYACAAGDRLLVEIGLGGLPVAAGGTQGHNGSIRWGCTATSGDLLENDSETGTTFRGWIEFANTFTFQIVQQPPRTMHQFRKRRN